MSLFEWNDENNEWLKQERGITFEDVVYHLTHDGVLDTKGLTRNVQATNAIHQS